MSNAPRTPEKPSANPAEQVERNLVQQQTSAQLQKLLEDMRKDPRMDVQLPLYPNKNQG